MLQSIGFYSSSEIAFTEVATTWQYNEIQVVDIQTKYDTANIYLILNS